MTKKIAHTRACVAHCDSWLEETKFGSTQYEVFEVLSFSATHGLRVGRPVARPTSNVPLRGLAYNFVACASRADDLVQRVGGR